PISLVSGGSNVIVIADASGAFCHLGHRGAPRMSAQSKADISSCPRDVRFTPKSGHWLIVFGCPLCGQKQTFVVAIPMSGLCQKARGPSLGTPLFSVALSPRSSLALLVAATRLRVGLPLNQSIKLSGR